MPPLTKLQIGLPRQDRLRCIEGDDVDQELLNQKDQIRRVLFTTISQYSDPCFYQCWRGDPGVWRLLDLVGYALGVLFPVKNAQKSGGVDDHQSSSPNSLY